MAATYRLLYSEQKGFCTIGPRHINGQTTDGREYCWACPEALGEGRFCKIQVRSGLDIWITDCCFEKEMVFSCPDHPDVLIFSFYLSGHASSCLGHSKYRLAASPGQQGVFYFPQPVGYSRVAAQTVFRHIAIMVRPDQLTSYLKDDLNLLPPRLQQIIHGRSDDPFCQIRDSTPPMISALQKLIYCPYHGMTVFAFPRKERLIRARQMIERAGFNVTETAYAVGYESISHFSQAYKKHFGMSPSRCRR